MASYSLYPHRPRHHVVDPDSLHVQLQRRVDELVGVLQGMLIDISRQGFCVAVANPLAEDEAVVLRLHDDNSGMDLTLAGTVRWSRESNDGRWSVGCSADQELAWETLGELFLNGILRMDDCQELIPPGK
jgi:hypothetical protein